ncbi:MAG: hypothetical protein WAT09_09685 [Paracoccaceae bacterium]
MPLKLILVVVCLLLLLRAVLSLPAIEAQLMAGDNDDLTRLVVVRDWLAGQGWFDTRQYRVLPPEGISMHWSRYVDAGIAALIVPLAWVLPVATAEGVALALWPSLLACLLIGVTAWGTDRILGRAAALGAILMALTWGKLGGFEFAPGRIDHHNVQMLCATAALFLSVVPSVRPLVAGVLAGLTSALALAVGLEMVPVLALIWAMASLRQAFALPGADRWLTGYAISIALAAPLLMAGQVPRVEWLVNHCDELAPPVLALLAIGVVATLVPVLAGTVLRTPLLRIATVAGLTALGLWLAAPLLGPCLAGPYADVTPEARAIIDNSITEARSVASLWQDKAEMVVNSGLPALMVTLLSLVSGWHLRHRLSPKVRLALLQMLAVAVLGLAVAMTQIRAMNLAAPAVPFLAGFVVSAFVSMPRSSRLRLPALLVMLAAVPPMVSMTIIATRPLRAEAAQDVTSPQAAPAGVASGAKGCRTPAAMAELQALPDSVLFTSLNLGAAVLAYTRQSVTAAPYHRSSDAFWNGIGAMANEATLQRALMASRADYLVLCRDELARTTRPFLKGLNDGTLPEWLAVASQPQGQMAIFKVDRSALTAAGDSLQ